MDVSEEIRLQNRRAEQAKLMIRYIPEAETLLDLCRTCQILGADRDAVRVIGEQLYADGGIKQMRRILLLIQTAYPNGYGGKEGWHPAEIDTAWDGIGEWLSHHR